YLWTGSSSPVASHPVSRRRSYLRLRTASVLSDGDFHPIVGAHSQAHVGGHVVARRVARGTPEQIDAGRAQGVGGDGVAGTLPELEGDMVDARFRCLNDVD